MRKFKSKVLNLNISDDVLSVFSDYVQDKKKKNESGGILLGQIKDNTIYLIKASVPNPFDKQSRYSFERNKEIAQIIVDHEFINSSNKTIYIGEWHTHPEDYPTPSDPDKRMIMNQLKLSKYIEPNLFIIIQGIKDLYVGIYDGKNLTKMEEVKSNS